MTASQEPQAVAGRPPNKRVYYHLFFAQVIALLSTGVATVALALLAYKLAGAEAGAVMGTALAIKMLAYVVIAPVAAAFAERLPRRALLVVLDLVRAAVALTLPFVTQVWHIYLLILVFQAASAAFTPAFQATIPDLLPDEEDYNRALSRSRLAHEFENLASPALAAGLLLIISFPGLFVGTTLGFLLSAALILRVSLPSATRTLGGGVLQRTTQGLRVFLATPRLRGLLGPNLATAAATAMVTVNTVVLVQAWLGLGERATGLALAAFGAGSVAGAIRRAEVRAALVLSAHDARRRRARGGRSAGRHRAAGLPHASCSLAGARAWLRACHDAGRQPAAPVRRAGGPPSRVCRAVCAGARRSAADLPAGRLAWRHGWHGSDLRGFGADGRRRAAAWRLWPRHDPMPASGIDPTRDDEMWRPDGSG